MKAKFFKRFIAYLIDILIVVILSTLITSFVPLNNNVKQTQEELLETLSNYYNEDFNDNNYLEKINNLNYNISKNTVILSLVDIVIYILYFMVYPVYNNGQTIGKKLVKIKIKSINGELTFNNLIIRSIVLYGIWLNLIGAILVMILNKSKYLMTINFLSNINSVIIIVILFMVAIRKDGRGLHDILSNTIVEEE
ncbi:MAG: RDD family protein [bacterium]|nr:RDD family protein [bacterium]